MDGLELTAALRQKYPDLPVLLCTAFTDTEYLLKAIELGVVAYIPKPIDTGRLLEAIRQAALPILQRLEIQRLKTEALRAGGLMIGDNPAMKALGGQIAQLAESDYSVVVRGEAGTGKSAVAELLHGLSGRRRKRLLTVDCRSRSADQLEAELFGRMPGRGRPSASRDGGVLNEINGGTLLLDAPELLPLPLQERILALLEKRAYLLTGGSEPLPCDVRVIALTSVDLDTEVAEGRFSRNLLMRLSDAVLNLPPLRERRDDIPAFCSLFLAQAVDDLGRACPEMAPDALALLQTEAWPGNIRQLKQFIRRAVFHAGAVITAADVEVHNAGAKNPLPLRDELTFKLTDLEQWAIERVLNATGGKKMQAAELLGISYNAFKDKLQRYGIS
jgi:DNA-binding NtrC family response regulator